MDENKVSKSAMSIKELEEENRYLKEQLYKYEMEKRAKTAFLAALGYEVKTPIHSIKSFAHKLSTYSFPLRVKKLLQHIEKNAITLGSLTQHLLELSHLDSEHFELQDPSCNLRATLEKSLMDAQKKALEKNLKLQLEIEQSTPHWIAGEAKQLLEFFLRLFETLIATCQKNSTLLFQVKGDSRHKSQVEIACHMQLESCKKIPLIKEELSHVLSFLDPAKTLKKDECKVGFSRDNKYHYFVSKGVEYQKGKQGSDCFNFQLIAKKLVESPKHKGIEVINHSFDHELGKKVPLRILVAEDNPSSQVISACFFNKFGYVVDVVANGQEAIEALKKHPYDLVFLDLKMPIMDGLQATKEIVQQNLKRQASLVALTANLLKSKEDVFSMGMDDYISKPLTPASIKRTLLCHISRYNFFSTCQDELKQIQVQSLVENLGSKEEALRYLEKFLIEVPKLLKQVPTLIKKENYHLLQKIAKDLLKLVNPLKLKTLCDKLKVLSKAQKLPFLDQHFLEECFFDSSAELNLINDHLIFLMDEMHPVPLNV